MNRTREHGAAIWRPARLLAFSREARMALSDKRPAAWRHGVCAGPVAA